MAITALVGLVGPWVRMLGDEDGLAPRAWPFLQVHRAVTVGAAGGQMQVRGPASGVGVERVAASVRVAPWMGLPPAPVHHEVATQYWAPSWVGLADAPAHHQAPTRVRLADAPAHYSAVDLAAHAVAVPQGVAHSVPRVLWVGIVGLSVMPCIATSVAAVGLEVAPCQGVAGVAPPTAWRMEAAGLWLMGPNADAPQMSAALVAPQASRAHAHASSQPAAVHLPLAHTVIGQGRSLLATRASTLGDKPAHGVTCSAGLPRALLDHRRKHVIKQAGNM